MVTPTSPFAFLEDFAERASESLKPPTWFVDESQRRLVLFLNHVLQQEPHAMARLAPRAGKVLLAEWRQFHLRLVVTPAGLFDRAASEAPADLTVTVTDESPTQLAKAALRGEKPAVRIEGDVELAGDVNWLAENLRWDVEDDLSRVIGDTPAHALGDLARRMAEGLRRFASKVGPGGKSAE